MKRFLLYFLFFSFNFETAFSMDCNLKEFTLSKLNIELDDKQYLEMVMGFSYGPEVKKFIPDLKSVESNFYYKESKAQQLMTFLTTKYKSNKIANEAFLHLKSKWLGNKKNKYDVIKFGNEVTWFGNNRLEQNCFQAIAKIEMDRLKK